YLGFARLSPGEVVLDLGSYSALTSILFSKGVGESGKVIAVEPDPLNHNVSTRNIRTHFKINHLRNIDLVEAAVGGATGYMELSAEGAMGSANADLVGRYRGATVKVRKRTLMDLVETYKLNRVDFVKMDIEGSEDEVISQSSSFFIKYKPRIVIEPHRVRGVRTDKAVVERLTSYGYECRVSPQTGIKTLPLIFATPPL
ncbi:MAG: FkbM family methyltransferase, partial [Sphingomicrobium sp.]